MYIKNLQLINFRSYEKLELDLSQGVNIFIGKNGEGKTNIVESIIYQTFLNSHRVSTVQPLIKLNHETAYIRSKISHPNREIDLVLELNLNKPNKAQINQNQTKSQKEVFGLVQSIYFSPEDLDLVRGDSAQRRKFLDEYATLKSPKTAALTSDYEKAIKQRNRLLKSRSNKESLAPWDEQVANLGGQIIAVRINLINELLPIFQSIYNQISDGKTATIQYKSSIEDPSTDSNLNSKKILTGLISAYQLEIDRGFTLFGPHRDDLLLKIDNQPAKTYASHGESWSIALALKLSLFKDIQKIGSKPILILDDVFAELDEDRRAHLLNVIAEVEQTFITCAVAGDLPKKLEGNKYFVRSGFVSNYEA